MYDRRFRPRLVRSLRVELNGTATQARDVSCAGLSAVFPRAARVGELVEGRLFFGRLALTFAGEVRWFRAARGEPARVGVKFLRADHALVEGLRRAAEAVR